MCIFAVLLPMTKSLNIIWILLRNINILSRNSFFNAKLYVLFFISWMLLIAVKTDLNLDYRNLINCTTKKEIRNWFKILAIKPFKSMTQYTLILIVHIDFQKTTEISIKYMSIRIRRRSSNWRSWKMKEKEAKSESWNWISFCCVLIIFLMSHLCSYLIIELMNDSSILLMLSLCFWYVGLVIYNALFCIIRQQMWRNPEK